MNDSNPREIVDAQGLSRQDLFRRLVETYDLPVERGRIKLHSNCGVPGLDRPDSRLCVMGILANSVVPHGDTIAGLKYIARRFAGDCVEAERVHRAFPKRVAMQLSLASASAKAMRTVRHEEQLA